jgi:diaminopropionate ammonia-lyase
MCRYFINPYRQEVPNWDKELTRGFDREDITTLHRSIPEYKPTPLVELTSLAEKLGIRRLLVKDESHRFGLNAFKAMGATYAVFRFLKDHFEKQGKTVPNAEDFYRNTDWLEPDQFTFCTATDGNHGRGVAWTARKLRQKAVIYMPGFSVKARVENIEKEGATVVIVDGSYDDAVSQMINDANKNGWQIISDHSWPGYTAIPEWIKAGYLTMFREIDDALGDDNKIDIVIVQVGVGALAAAVSYYYNGLTAGKRATPVGVEPVQADCILQSMASEKGEPITIGGTQDSIMAGLNCATPSLMAWPFLKSINSFD